MLSYITKRRLLWFTATCIFVFVTLKVYAGIALQNTINPSAEIFNYGRQVVLTGPLRCSEQGNTALRVTLTQRSTGAVAEGQIVFECSTNLQQWTVVANTRGQQRFEPGPAVAVALGHVRSSSGGSEDAHQWLVNVNLYNGIGR